MGKHAGNQGGQHTGTTDLIRTVLSHGPATAAQIRERTGLSQGAVDQALTRLRDRSEIMCQRGMTESRAGLWSITGRCDGSALDAAWPAPVALPAQGDGRVVRAEVA